MNENIRIYEKKSNQRKSITKTIRLTPAQNETLVKKATEAEMNQTDYIVASCLNSNINHIPYSAYIAITLHQIHTIISGDAYAQSTDLANKISQLVLLADSTIENIQMGYIMPFYRVYKIKRD